MDEAVRQQYEAYPEPSPTREPIGPAQLDRMDDNLHFGWSWHRHQYCYREAKHLRILDAGCGTGLSTLALARLNPGAAVLGIDASPRALELAASRAAVTGMPAVKFAAHDLDAPLPAAWGSFDFIVCRGVLGQAEDADRLLANLAGALDGRGLLHLTVPSRHGRQAPRQLRRAVEALAGPDATLEERVGIALELFHALRPDHAIRQYETGLQGNRVPTRERILAGYLSVAERDWTLAEAVGLVERADLQFLFAASRWPWQAERVFVLPTVSPELKQRVGKLGALERALLIDALDPVLHLDDYRIFACPSEFEPRLPSWPEERLTRPDVFDRLIPHPSGLGDPAIAGQMPSRAASFSTASALGRVLYRTVTGGRGELDEFSDRLLRAVDGRRCCGEIDRMLGNATGVADSFEVRQERWIGLADSGLLLLESREPREHVDCRYLGRVVDRLDCACPRRWIRACERHGHCTLMTVGRQDAAYPALTAALDRRGLSQVPACAECADYDPEVS
jgi:SAM-dependent methyltransferase